MRAALVALMFAVILAATANAQSAEQKLPFARLSADVLVQAPETKMQILFYYSVTCPFCRQVHEDIVRWAMGLPAEYEFREIQVITEATIPAAKIIEAGRHIGGAAAEHRLILTAYQQIQSQYRRVDSAETWAGIVDASNVSASKISTAVTSQYVDNRILNNIKLQNLMGITATPTIVVSGRYRVDLDNANGKPESLIKILNALVSTELRGEVL